MSFLRGKQAGIPNDLSAGILPGLFAADDQEHFGLNGQVSALAYDPVQSLLAVGTHQSTIYVFGQKRVQATFKLPRYATVQILQFNADRLISVDSKGEMAVWSLRDGKRVGAFATASLTVLVTDPGLDWAMIGQQNGEVIFYDLDRMGRAPLRLPNLWKQQQGPGGRSSAFSPVVSMQLHPRDIGKLLIGYAEGAVIYSFKQNQATKQFEYVVPPGAVGGSFADDVIMANARRPRLTHAVWHPHGTFILTAHEDGSLVFWDPKDGRVVAARNLETTKINVPGANSTVSIDLAARDPYKRISWCVKDNDDTALFITGGQPTSTKSRGFTFLELGPTPVYTTSTWQVLEKHFDGRRTSLLPVPMEIADYCLIPRTSPHFAGAHDPIASIVLLNSGELITLSFPSGYPISPTNQLPPSLTVVHPFVTLISVAPVSRERWLGMVETRSIGTPLLKGGSEEAKPLRRHEHRNIIQMAHGDGIVRLWDAGYGDELENGAELQVDTARALDRHQNVQITQMKMAQGNGELAVGMRSGEVILYHWNNNKHFGQQAPQPSATRAGGLTIISDRAEPSLKLGLQPHVLYDLAKGPITALDISDVGFVGVGSEGGVVSIIDLRGPAVIFSGSMTDFTKSEKRGKFFKSNDQPQRPDWPVVINFGIMQLEGDDYSSIVCFVGTALGQCLTFKILPQGAGFTAKFVGATSMDGKVISLCPINPDTGKLTLPTPAALGALRNGQQFSGILVAVTENEVRMFKPPSNKGAHKSWDGMTCHSACVSESPLRAFAIVCVFSDSTTRAYSIPALKEIGMSRLAKVDANRLKNSIVTSSGNLFVWTGPTEIAMLDVWGAGEEVPRKSKDVLINPDLQVPTRPTISNLQWISGTQYVSPTDLDLLVGGPDRPPSRRMLEAAAAEKRLARQTARDNASRVTSSTEGWGDYMARQLSERTDRLNLVGDSMDQMSESSAGFLDDVNKFVSDQKKAIVMRGVMGKFM